MASRLTPAARQRAVDFIRAYGTNLLTERYHFHFDGGNAANVIAALRHYQNPDGGFGHGLEADLRTRNSSVIATTVALQILLEVDSLSTPAARGALAYLEDKYENGTWPLIDAHCNDAPHAPWWTYSPGALDADFSPNPSAEILSYLLATCAMDKSTRSELLVRAIEYSTQHRLEMHELQCYLRLLDCPALPAHARQALTPAVEREVLRLVKRRPVDWEEYSLAPLDIIADPASPFANHFGDAVEANFEHRIAMQNDDGSWSPTWSWGNTYPEAWREAEREIKGTLTLRFLVQLDRFGKL